VLKEGRPGGPRFVRSLPAGRRSMPQRAMSLERAEFIHWVRCVPCGPAHAAYHNPLKRCEVAGGDVQQTRNASGLLHTKFWQPIEVSRR